MNKFLIAFAVAALPTSAFAQTENVEAVAEVTSQAAVAPPITEVPSQPAVASPVPVVAPPPVPVVAPPPVPVRAITLPKDTLLRVASISEVTSKKMKEGQTRKFRVAEEVRRNGVTVIPLNAPVEAEVTWRTGKGVFGKSAKFELTFRTVEIDGKTYKLDGKHRQEGRGNTAAALLVSGIITGRSAVIVPDQVINARTAEDITVTPSR